MPSFPSLFFPRPDGPSVWMVDLCLPVEDPAELGLGLLLDAVEAHLSQAQLAAGELAELLLVHGLRADRQHSRKDVSGRGTWKGNGRCWCRDENTHEGRHGHVPPGR